MSRVSAMHRWKLGAVLGRTLLSGLLAAGLALPALAEPALPQGAQGAIPAADFDLMAGAPLSERALSERALPEWVPAAIDDIEGFEVVSPGMPFAEAAFRTASFALTDQEAPQGSPQLTPEQRQRRQRRLRAEEQGKNTREAKPVDPARSTFEFPLPAERGGGTVTGNAAEIDAASGSGIVLAGGVDFAYQDIHIEAERIELDLENQTLTATGGVILDQGPRRLTGESASFNLDDKTGTLTNATAYLEPDYFFTGSELKKTGDDSYVVVDGIFTSCAGEVPAWSFKVRQARIDVGGYAHIRGASFRVKKAPLLYFPYILWPAKLDRASGFLVAQPGYSSRRGTSLSTAYFQTLGRSADTTVFTDLYSAGFIGVGNELRYRPSEGTKGIFEGYAIRDPDDDRWRWKLRLNHVTEDLPLGLRGVISYDDYSDFQYFEQFERDFDRATLRQIHSRGFLSGNWGTHSLNLQIDSQETLIAFDNPDTEANEDSAVILRSLPEAEYRLRSTQLGSLPLYLQADASVAQLDVDRSSDYNSNYGRVDLFPSVELPIKSWPWISMSLTGGYRFTWWGDSLCNLATDETGAPIGGGERCVDGVQRFTGESFERATPVFTADIFGPSFSRIYDKEIGDFGKFKHIIAPRVTYGYVNVEDPEQGRAPLFDERDSFASANSVRVALINKVLGKPKPKPPKKSAEAPDEETDDTQSASGQAAIEPNLGLENLGLENLGVGAAETPAMADSEQPDPPGSESGDGSSAEETSKDQPADAQGDTKGEAASEDAAESKGEAESEDAATKAPAPAVSGGSSREIFSFELAQSYSFDADQPLQRGDGREDQASPLSALVRFNPTDGTSLKAEVFYNTLFSRITSTTLSGSYLFPGQNTVGLTYVNRVRPIDGTTESDQLRVWTSLNLVPRKLKLDAQLNYNIDTSVLQQQRYVLRYTGACYGVQLEFRDSQFGTQREQDYRLAITLKNVGTFLDLSGRNSGSGF
jgi:lipopolysaccharide assembly outer membrane protein LptD (OstA)